MATTNRDFRVKHGIAVAEGGTFGGTVSVATPTENNHAATKLYVDSAVSSPSVPVTGTEPVSPSNGDLWFDTNSERINVYYNSEWIPIATIEDAEELQDHIHDTSIEGSGLVVGTFVDGGFYNESGISINGGSYNTASFASIYDGGLVSDIYSLFVDAGSYNVDGILVNGGFYYTEEFEATYNAGAVA